VKAADQCGGSCQALPGFEQVEPIGPGHRPWDEIQDLPAALVNAQRPGRTVEADRVQIQQQRVYRRCMWPSWPAHRVTDPDHSGTRISAKQGFLYLVHTT
jgi:hypothetical protein